MGTVSAARLFSDAFNWFASLSSKLPGIDFKTFFIVVVALLIGVGVVVGLTYLGSYRFKLLVANRKIIRYLADADSIDDDNVKDFTDQCFSAKAPTVLCDSWKLYLGVRFGYPSDIVSESTVYDKVVKRVREVRASVFIGIALVLIAAFAFWGYGTLDGNDMGVIFCASLLLSGAIYIVLVMLNRLLSKRCLEVFDEMQIELDAKVDLQVDKSYATDSSPLAELAAIVDEIVARNTAKNVGFEINSEEETPIEKLIANAQQSEDVIDIADFEHDFYEIEKYEDELDGVKPTDGKDGTADDSDKSDKLSDGLDDDEGEDIFEDDTDEEESDDNSDDDSQDEAFEEEGDKDGVEGNDSADMSDGEANDDEVEQPDEVENASDEAEEATAQDSVEDIKATDDTDAEEQSSELDTDEPVDDDDEGVEGAENADNGDYENELADGDESYDDAIDGDGDNLDDGESQSEEHLNEENSGEENELADDEEHSESDVSEDESEIADQSENSDESKDDDEYALDDDSVEDGDGADEDDEEESKENSDGVVFKTANVNEDGVEVREIIDYTEEDEYVKPARLVKLPNLVDYVIANNPSPTMLINVSRLMLIARAKFEHSTEDRRIVDNCIGKLIMALHNAYMTTKL
ncbi:MAG: hypothetical protein K2G31_04675 [Clostridia bacterium]|nr:hypothetical protein [Clostridia bacterium]